MKPGDQTRFVCAVAEALEGLPPAHERWEAEERAAFLARAGLLTLTDAGWARAKEARARRAEKMAAEAVGRCIERGPAGALCGCEAGHDGEHDTGPRADGRRFKWREVK